MFNNELKEECLSRLKKSEINFVRIRVILEAQLKLIFEYRCQTPKKVIIPVENYINTLAKAPVELKKSVSELQVNYDSFGEVFKMQKEYSDMASKNISRATSAVAVTSAGIAALAPKAAMAAATTFGVASTGAPIASLSGAAATNAALAWLGGGALTAGGGGMAAGNALLAMAGPIGWGISGLAILGGAWRKCSNNKQIANEATKAALEYDRRTHVLVGVEKEAMNLYNITKSHTEGVKKQLYYLSNNAPKDYARFTVTDANELQALINNINSLTKLINKRIDTGGKL